MEIRYPDLKTRIQSTFIDTILMVVLMFAAAILLEKINPSQEEEDGWIRGVIFISIWGIYEPVAMTIGCTLGNYLMKIRVKKHSDITKRINLLQAYIRFIVKILLGWISFLTIHSNKERRAIHDFAAGSMMIEK
jgi:uncharacterized RDD family membrane protein YckC